MDTPRVKAAHARAAATGLPRFGQTLQHLRISEQLVTENKTAGPLHGVKVVEFAGIGKKWRAVIA